MSSGEKIATRVVREADRLGLSNVELAAMLGLSLPWTLELRRRGVEPQTLRARRNAEAFLKRAAVAKSRFELRLPALAA